MSIYYKNHICIWADYNFSTQCSTVNYNYIFLLLNYMTLQLLPDFLYYYEYLYTYVFNNLLKKRLFFN